MALKLVTLAQGTVAASGTEVRASSTSVDKVVKIYISCPATNTGSIYVGDSSVSTTRGIEVPKGTTLVLCEDNGGYIDLQEIWVDAASSGDKFNVSYLQKVSQ